MLNALVKHVKLVFLNLTCIFLTLLVKIADILLNIFNGGVKMVLIFNNLYIFAAVKR